ncbi:hypothetical protein KI387_036556, partial [Taxus chinensis]
MVMERVDMIEGVIAELTMVIQDLKGRVDKLVPNQVPRIVEVAPEKAMEELTKWK